MCKSSNANRGGQHKRHNTAKPRAQKQRERESESDEETAPSTNYYQIAKTRSLTINIYDIKPGPSLSLCFISSLSLSFLLLLLRHTYRRSSPV
nr:hypothetical protein CFP56_15937 [Quercus suber]